MLDRETLAAWIDEVGLAHLKDTILATVRPSIRLTLSVVESEDSIPIDASKFGGLPDMPPNFAWPHYGERPLSFVAQIRLEDAAPHDMENLLPTTGLLSFFYDSAQWIEGKPFENAHWQVIYYDGVMSQLRRAGIPANLAPCDQFKPCKVSFASHLTSPPWESYDGFKKLGFAYGKPDDTDTDLFFKLVKRTYTDHKGYVSHRMLGHPDQIQGDIFVEAESVAISDDFVKGIHDKLYASPDSGIQDWLLLLQVDSEDDITGMMWGDVGRLYYCIKREALAAKRFDQAICTMQCT